MNRIITLTIFVLLLCGCSHTKKTTDTEQPFEIRFGQTGGFTNVTVEFVIRENREVFRIQNDEAVRINNIRVKEMKEIRNMIDSVDFKNLSSGEPGNVSYFIKVTDPEYEKAIQWTNVTEESPLNKLYHLLLSTLKNRS
jgi:hypothetical protein